MISRLVSLLGSTPFKDQVRLLILKKGRGHYLKEILFLNSFSFEDKDPRFTKLKPNLALRSLSKGLFYIRAMGIRL